MVLKEAIFPNFRLLRQVLRVEYIEVFHFNFYLDLLFAKHGRLLRIHRIMRAVPTAR